MGRRDTRDKDGVLKWKFWDGSARGCAAPKEPASITDHEGGEISTQYELVKFVSRMADNAHVYKP